MVFIRGVILALVVVYSWAFRAVTPIIKVVSIVLYLLFFVFHPQYKLEIDACHQNHLKENCFLEKQL